MAKNQTSVQVGTQENLEEKKGFYWVLARPEIALLITLGALVAGLANLWIISKLAPITENLAVVTTRVSALETFNEGVVSRPELNTKFTDITGRLDTTISRLDRIESKLDRLIESR